MEETLSKNKGGIIAAIVVGVIIVTAGLILLARGGGYELSVMDPVVGPDQAPLVLEEFSDFQCGACAAAAPKLAAALEQFPTQVKFIYQDFPLAQHSNARGAASAALCAAQQDQFKPFHDKLFEGQQTWASAHSEADGFFVGIAAELSLDMEDWNLCRSSRDARQAVQADVDEGFERGVSSTPTFFLNGAPIETPASVFGWVQLFEKELEKQGITPEMNSESDDSADEEEKDENLE